MRRSAASTAASLGRPVVPTSAVIGGLARTPATVAGDGAVGRGEAGGDLLPRRGGDGADGEPLGSGLRRGGLPRRPTPGRWWPERPRWRTLRTTVGASMVLISHERWRDGIRHRQVTTTSVGASSGLRQHGNAACAVSHVSVHARHAMLDPDLIPATARWWDGRRRRWGGSAGGRSGTTRARTGSPRCPGAPPRSSRARPAAPVGRRRRAGDELLGQVARGGGAQDAVVAPVVRPAEDARPGQAHLGPRRTAAPGRPRRRARPARARARRRPRSRPARRAGPAARSSTPPAPTSSTRAPTGTPSSRSIAATVEGWEQV